VDEERAQVPHVLIHTRFPCRYSIAPPRINAFAMDFPELKTMSVRSVRPIVAVLLTAALGACASHRSIEDEIDHSNRRVVDALQFHTFTTDEPIELRTSGPLAVNVENFAGDVLVKADPMAESTVVEVRRMSVMGLGRWQESRDELDDVKWTATLEPREGGGDTLQVRATAENPEPHFFRARVVVVTPSLDRVTVRTSQGSVTVLENQGPVDIETTRGDVRMLTPWPMTQPIKIITSQGSIDYRVRGESKGAFDAESHGGEVRQRCEYGRWRALAAGNDHDRMLATLNDGTNPVFLRTSEKNIRVAVVADPTNVGREIHDP
jgi:hypothetical protein